MQPGLVHLCTPWSGKGGQQVGRQGPQKSRCPHAQAAVPRRSCQRLCASQSPLRHGMQRCSLTAAPAPAPPEPARLQRWQPGQTLRTAPRPAPQAPAGGRQRGGSRHSAHVSSRRRGWSSTAELQHWGLPGTQGTPALGPRAWRRRPQRTAAFHAHGSMPRAPCLHQHMLDVGKGSGWHPVLQGLQSPVTRWKR